MSDDAIRANDSDAADDDEQVSEAHAREDAGSVSGRHARAATGRFRPGQSGNPRGRPRKEPEPVFAMMARVLGETVSLTRGGKVVEMSCSEAMFRAMCHRAMTDPRLGREVFRLATAREAAIDTADMDARLAQSEAAFARSDRAGAAPSSDRTLGGWRSRARSRRRQRQSPTRSGRRAMRESIDMMSAALRADLALFVEQAFATLEPGTAFSPNWHYEHLCWALMRVLRGEVRRLIINVPPRSGKSIIASVALPMFAVGHAPNRRIICVSHTEDLARKFSIDRRAIAQSSWFGAAFPAFRPTGRRPRDLEMTTTLRGSVLAAGMGGAVLGRGADLIVIDDPIKAVDALSQAERRRVNEAFDSTLLTRLNDKQRGAIVIVMQRLHADDLVGHVVARDDWEMVSLPAIATEDACHRLSDVPGDCYRRRAGELLHPRASRWLSSRRCDAPRAR
ncbi:DUF5681 domain-containing protein [Methylobacterium phyllosphaerae]